MPRPDFRLTAAASALSLLAVSAAFDLNRADVVGAEPAMASHLPWVTNGNATTGTTIGNTLYIGGSFTRVAPSSAALGSLYAISATTGTVVPGLPLVDGQVTEVEPDGTGGFYVRGRFSRVGGVARTNLVRLRADGSLDPAFVAPFGLLPHGAMAVGTSALFLYSEPQILALDRATGARLTWSPPGGAFALTAVPLFTVGTNVVAVVERASSIVVAVFDQASGALIRESVIDAYRSTPRVAAVAGTRLIVTTLTDEGPDRIYPSLVAVDLTTGAVDLTWKQLKAVTPVLPTGIPPRWIRNLVVAGSTLFVAGEFSEFGGQPRANLAAVDLATATVAPWAPTANGPVTAMAPSANGVVIGGAFTTVNGDAREGLAEVSVTGSTTPWQSTVASRAFHTIRQMPGGALVVGGRMAIDGGVVRHGLAAFDLSTDTLLPWAPSANGVVHQLLSLADRIFVGSAAPGSQIPNVVHVFDATSAARLAWPLDTREQGPGGVRLTFAHDQWIYLWGLRDRLHDRVDPVSGAIDRGWSTGGEPLGFIGDRLYVHGARGEVQAQDARSGILSTWGVSVSRFIGSLTSPTSVVADGSTIVVGTQAPGSSLNYGSAAFDAESARLTTSPFSEVWRPQSVDGLLLSGSGPRYFGEPPLGGAIRAMSPDGAPSTSWVPELTKIDPAMPGALLATPTDVVMLGVEGVSPTPVSGVAVYRRLPPRAPHALRWSAQGNVVTFTWTPPAIAPAGYTLEVGSQPGLTDLAQLPLGLVTTLTATAPSGTFFVRVRPQGVTGDAAFATNEVAAVIGCTRPPDAPSQLVTDLAGSLVTLRWDAPPFDAPAGYLLEAGSAPGRADLAAVQLGGTGTTFSADAPPGTYHLRVRAVSACGRSAATPDVFVTVGSTDTLPAAPGQPTSTVSGRTVTLQWPPVPGALSYRLEAGSAARLADLAQVQVAAPGLSAPGVPPGQYFIRVRAVTAAGLGPPSPELVVTVPF